LAVETPSGTVTFLFTDIEGSTRRWEESPAAMADALAHHDRIVRGAIEIHDGYIFSTGGDGFAAAFSRVVDAAAAAAEAQVALAGQTWREDVELRVRMALHTGEAWERGGDYLGPAVNRAARLMAAGHGGQVLCSAATASLLSSRLPDEVSLLDLGEHRLRDLSQPERVFQFSMDALPQDFPPLRSLDSFPGNLPIQPTAFVGRRAELAEVTKALQESRVVTLCGVGGVGKTRLALQVAAELTPQFEAGAWLVELAPVGSTDAFGEAIASALGVQQRPGTTLAQSTLDFVRDKELLVVLDNCEHVLNEAAQFVDGARRVAPGLKILATSREGLAVAGERVVTIPSMELPQAEMPEAAALQTEAIRLFVDRARESNSAFSGDTADLPSMVELCTRLDGIPLAIELAAARVRGMSPAEITDHLDRRFKLLTRGRRTATTRHQTLRNTIDWSYDLLDASERRVLRRLAVFCGPFDADAAQSVAAGEDLDAFDVLDILVRLVEKSLVVAESGAETRYRLLETIRDYAFERLQEAEELDPMGERHARYFLEFALGAGAGLEGPEELVWRSRVERELENLRGALRWALDAGDADLALTEIYALSNIGSLRAPPFGLMALEAAEMPGASGHPLRAAALGAVCMALTQQGELARALRFADAALAAAEDRSDTPDHRKMRCRLNGCLTVAVAYSGDSDRLVALARQQLEAARALEDRFEIARAVILLSGTLGPEHSEEALAAGEEGLSLVKEVGVPSYRAWASMILGGRLAAVDPTRAEQLLDDAIATATSAANEWATVVAWQTLALLKAERGDYRAAAQCLVAMADAAHGSGDHGSAQQATALLAFVLAVLGDEEAALLLGAWAESRGHIPEGVTVAAGFHSAFRVENYLRLRDGQPRDVLAGLDQQAAALDENAILDLVRRRLDGIGSP
jgi:predicted ATPase/class 3 adenylate cyclase